MISIGELLIAKDAEAFNWDWIEAQLQKEAAKTYFPTIKMAPARVCLNAWASYRVCETVSLDDVVCSPTMAAVGSEEPMPDPARPKPKERANRILHDAHKTYQADPKKYERRPGVSIAVLLCSAVVDQALSDQQAPLWFAEWLSWRYPETGRYSQDREPGRASCYEWAQLMGGRIMGGLLVKDKYGRRSVASLVQKMDAEFMHCLREVCKLKESINPPFSQENSKESPISELDARKIV